MGTRIQTARRLLPGIPFVIFLALPSSVTAWEGFAVFQPETKSMTPRPRSPHSSIGMPFPRAAWLPRTASETSHRFLLARDPFDAADQPPVPPAPPPSPSFPDPDPLESPPVRMARNPGWSFSASLAAGVGYDTLKWNIASLTGTPNILSELTWDNVISGTGMIEAQFRTARWSLDAEVSYGKILDGRNQDDDFALNDRQGLFSRSESEADDHDLQSAALTLGYDVLHTTHATLRAIVGGRVYRQRFRMTNGRQIVPPTGPFPNLNTTYTATWFGPTVGIGVDGRIPKTRMRVHAFLTGIAAWYRGRANWNLREDFQQDPSFLHRDIGWGLANMIKIAYPIGRQGEVFFGERFLFFYGGKREGKTVLVQ